MKRTSIFIALATGLMALFLLAACGSTEDRLTGTWITESATAEVDSSMANLQSIDKVIASTKTTTFVLNEDYTMTLTIDGYSTDAFWTYNEDDGMVSFRLESDPLDDAMELGKYEDGKIIYTSKVKHGSITAVYMKE